MITIVLTILVNIKLTQPYSPIAVAKLYKE